MAKKEYLSPEMKEVKISSQATLLTGSCLDVYTTSSEGECADEDAD